MLACTPVLQDQDITPERQPGGLISYRRLLTGKHRSNIQFPSPPMNPVLEAQHTMSAPCSARFAWHHLVKTEVGRVNFTPISGYFLHVRLRPNRLWLPAPYLAIMSCACSRCWLPLAHDFFRTEALPSQPRAETTLVIFSGPLPSESSRPTQTNVGGTTDMANIRLSNTDGLLNVGDERPYQDAETFWCALLGLLTLHTISLLT